MALPPLKNNDIGASNNNIIPITPEIQAIHVSAFIGFLLIGKL
jgi:hypothetical protein